MGPVGRVKGRPTERAGGGASQMIQDPHSP